jgi:hypothetical protein
MQPAAKTYRGAPPALILSLIERNVIQLNYQMLYAFSPLSGLAAIPSSAVPWPGALFSPCSRCHFQSVF